MNGLGLSSVSVIPAEDCCLPGRTAGRAGQREEVWLRTGWLVYQRRAASPVLFDLQELVGPAKGSLSPWPEMCLRFNTS